VTVADGEVTLRRAYDTVPDWYERGEYSSPDLPDLSELRARPAEFQPDWADLREQATRTEGVPGRFAALAREVLGRDVRTV
jgi:hypothetical protein